MLRLLRFLLSIGLSAVPPRYRQRLLADYDEDVQRGALVSGIAEIVVALGVFIGRYLWLIQKRPADIAEAAMRTGAEGALATEHAQFSIGILTLMEYVIQPMTLVVMYFIIEGVARAAAALVTREVVPSLPLQAIAWVHGAIEKKQAEKALGPVMVDEVRPGTDCDLEIASCRRREWTPMLTISYQETLYELAGSELRAGARPYIYKLRKANLNKAFRGLHHYSPDELLPPPEER